jgi:hypothetical protein
MRQKSFASLRSCVAGMFVVAGLAATTVAQTIEQNAARLQAQVYDTQTGQWDSTVQVVPGTQVEFRYVVSYLGTNTNVLGLGNLRYQPSFSNVALTGDAVLQDSFAPWRNGGTQGNGIAGSVLTSAQANSGNAISGGYGIATFGATAMQSPALNILSTFTHSGGSGGAPPGTWLRIAGSSVTEWLPDTIPGLATTAQQGAIARGVVANQLATISSVSGQTNTFWSGGTQNLVVFRGAMVVGQSPMPRTVSVSVLPGSFLRGTASDDTRFMTWHTSVVGLGGTYFTSIVTVPATIVVGGVPFCDSVDFNGNGVFPEDRDIIDFIDVLAGAPCPTGTCNDVDFNNDGEFPEDQDLISFITVLLGGECE